MKQVEVPKLFYKLPEFCEYHIPREGLLKKLHRAFREDEHLIYITGPGGMGKTLLVAHWFRILKAQEDKIQTHWICIKKNELNCFSFKELLFHGFSEYFPDLKDTFPEENLPPSVTLLPIIHGIQSSSDKHFLCLDDLQHIENPEDLQTLKVLLQLLPDNLYILATSRVLESQIFLYWGIRPYLLLNTQDLYFSKEETRKYLKKKHTEDFSEEHLARIYHESKGWISAIRLYDKQYPILQNSSPEEGDPSNHQIHHFYIKLYESLSPGDQAILRTSLVLQEFSLELLQWFFPKVDINGQLCELLCRGFFLEQMDPSKREFRFHSIITEALDRYIDKETRDTIFCKAAEWHLDRGNLLKALDFVSSMSQDYYYSSAGAMAVTETIRQCLISGRPYLFMGIGEKLDHRFFKKYSLCFGYYYIGLILLYDIKGINTFQPLVEALAETSWQNISIKVLASLFHTFIKKILQLPITTDYCENVTHQIQGIQDFKGFEEDLVVYPTLLYFYNTILFYSGKLQPSLGYFQRHSSKHLANKTHWIYYKASVQYRLIALIHGVIDKKKDEFLLKENTFLNQHLKNDLIFPSILSSVIQGDQRSSMEKIILASSMYSTHGMSMEMSFCDYLYTITNIYFRGKRFPQEELENIEKKLKGITGTDDFLRAVLETYYPYVFQYYKHKLDPYKIMAVQLPKVSMDLCFQNPPFYFVYFISMRFRVIHLDEGIMDTLEEDINKCERREAHFFRIWLMLLKAFYYYRIGDVPFCRELLVKSWNEAHSRSIGLPFIAEGDLFYEDKSKWIDLQTGNLPSQLVDTLSYCLKEGEDNGAQHLIDPLRPREREILILVDQGLTNKDISDRLCVSIHTVKWNLNNSFHKLMVKNRIQAVKKAKRYGVI